MPLLPKPKRVLLLAVSCKKGGLCPGGVDLDNPSQWIRIVRDDGYAGSVQSFEIDYAQPLDVIEFTGHPVPRGVQKENWAIDFNSCRKVQTCQESIMKSVYEKYGYHGFWKNSRAYLDEYEMDVVDQESIPSESLLHVRNVFIYKNPSGKAKLDFDWGRFKLKGISMTDPDYYDPLNAGNEVRISEAIIVVSIPYAADFTFPGCSSGRGYKFVSKIFDYDALESEQKQQEQKNEFLDKDIPFYVMPNKQLQQPSSSPWQSAHSAVGSSTVNSISDKAVANQQQQATNAKPIEHSAQQQQQPKSQQQHDDNLTQPNNFTDPWKEVKRKEAAQLAKQSLSKAPQEKTMPKEDFAPKVKLQTQQKPRSTFWADILKIFGLK